MTETPTGLENWPLIDKSAPIELGHFYFFTFDQYGSFFPALANPQTLQEQFFNAEEDAYGPYTHFDIKAAYVYTNRKDIDYGILAQAVKNDAGVGSIGEFLDKVCDEWSKKVPGKVRLVEVRNADKTQTAPPPAEISPPPPPSELLETLKWLGVGAAVVGTVYLVMRFWPRR